jgi:hypothetical protein
MLTNDDVRSDPIIVRRIRRLQQAEAADAEDSSEDEVQAPRRETMQLDGSNDEPQLPVRATQRPPQSSIVEDLGAPSDSDMSG